MSIYAVDKPTYMGTYPIRDAALYIKATMTLGKLPNLTTRHLYHWTREGLSASYLKGIRNRRLFITFSDLVSLRVIAALRAKGITPDDIRVIDKELRAMFGWEQPFATAEFWTAQPDVLMNIQGMPMSITRHWQIAMDHFIQQVQPVQRLSFDMYSQAATWTPVNGVLLDPQVQFGEPCIQGTRIPTQVVWAFHHAGDSINEIADAYGITTTRIEEAVDWERKLQEAPA